MQHPPPNFGRIALNSGRIAGFLKLFVHSMVKYIIAEGAGDLAFGEGLKRCILVIFLNIFFPGEGSLSLLEF